jgi:hypothetical protein
LQKIPMKTDPGIGEVVRDLVEWMDGWEWIVRHTREAIKINGSEMIEWTEIKQSLDIVREIEVTVEGEGLLENYSRNLRHEVIDFDYATSISYGDFGKGVTADPKPRLRALHKTLREEGEI